MKANQCYLVAADTGGTFTDLAVYDVLTNEIRFGKTLTTYKDLVVGVMEGLQDTGAPLAKAAVFTHGTTHIINSFIERRGGCTALITTRGFRDVLEIGRGNRADPFDLTYRRDPPLIPRNLRYEVEERLDGQGNVIVPLNTAELESLAAELRAAKVEAVAISFLNAYRNPAHEITARDLLKVLLPGIFVTTGTELSREWMEYERTATVAANAFVGSRMARYIDGFNSELRARDFSGNFYLMGSNGGVMSAASAISRPVALVESGPVGGCIGATAYARALGLDRLIAFDMGGTTAKCALIEDGVFDVNPTYFVGGYERGFPIRTPVLDIVEVGAGGGSLAWIDEHGRMRLGPRSAGSDPGPIAFRRGGTEPTVTDANVVLGRIGSDSFMNGKLKLDIAAATDGVRRALAEPLGFEGASGVDRVAQGILDLATVTMASAIKEITIERGHDARVYQLFAFGGGGPIFATELARNLGIRTVIIPPNPGSFSSFGMLLAPVRRDVAHSFLQPLTPESLVEALALYTSMEKEGRAAISEEVDVSDITFKREADMSYIGQSHTVKVSLPAEATEAAVKAAFEEAYRTRYGHLNEDSRINVVVLRVVCEVVTAQPNLERVGAGSASGNPSEHAWRDVYFSANRKRIHTPIYRRPELPPGFALTGPAVIEEFSSTTIVGPGDELVVGQLGELQIRCALSEGSKP